MDTRALTALSAPVLPAALLLALTLAGCVVGPDYKRPVVTPASEFRSHVGPAEATSIADLPWWQVFNDKALHRLVTLALQENYDLQAAVARIEQARALVAVTRSDWYPQLGYEGIAAREKTYVPLERFVPFEDAAHRGNITYNSFEATVNVAWELDVWGRIHRATEAARANLFAQEDIRRGVMLTLVSDVAAGYFALLELDRELAIAQESSDTFKKTLDLFNLRFRAGRDSKLAVVRAQANYESSSVRIATLSRAIIQQENALSVLLGAYPREIERGIKLTDQGMPATPAGLTTDIIKRRPDIRQAEQVMIGANAEVGVAVANFFPRVGLSALYGGQAPRIEDIFNNDFSVWHIGAGISGPIFQGGRLYASYEAQKAFWDETISQYRKTIVTAFRETSDALIAQQTLVAQRDALQRQVGALRESVSLSLTRYDAGRATYFEVLEAEQSLFPTEDALAQTQRDQLVAVVNLYKALGGGWNVKDADWLHPD